ncbi:MAG: glycosyltransferase family 4 protein, partial [Verrucomicrobia bacterium]|nr:glycosyltransferase family 4 protein [Verrucomicrobiota bacterium]
MKIGLVRRGYSSTGGAERFLLRFAEGLRELGHQSVLFSDCAWPDSVWDSSHGESIRLSDSGKVLNPLDFADALEEARPKQHCDFLFSFERVWTCDAYRAGDGVHQAWLQRRAQFEAPLKTWFRGKQKKHRQLLELEAALYSPQSNIRIVANSQIVKKEINDLYGLPEDRIVVIANGYDAENISPKARLEIRRKKRTALGLVDDELAVMFAGSGWERKGLTFAMQAFEGLKKERKARLIVAGKGNKPRGISDEGIVFLGGVNSLTSLYEAADVFILP